MWRWNSFFFWIPLALSVSAVERHEAQDTERPSCGVYLAPSTIPGAGLGMFAGKDYREGETVMEGDLVIPLIEMKWHNPESDWFLWNDYDWNSDEFFGMTEETEDENMVKGASPGVGAAINCILPLVNLQSSQTRLDSAGLHRAKDPGAGAITPYHDRQGHASQDIPAGQELFISYGESYFRSRPDVYGHVPTEKEYEWADDFIQNFQQTIGQADGSHQLKLDLWNMVMDFPFQSKKMNALPKNATDLDEVAVTGASKQFYKYSIRNLDWLKENGKCMDNIRPGLSTIPQAGRGAFATRFIAKGGLVAPAPLIHIPDKSRLIMYDAKPEPVDGYEIRDFDAPVSRQLLVNYCFGHANSTLLLSPYGSFVSLINHSSKAPNARIQWANDMQRADWLEWSPADLEEEYHTGLSFDFVALDDIEEGDEILIDYGDEWQDAWDAHVRNWAPPERSKDYMAAYELNNDLDLVVRTVHERPYPDTRLWVYAEYKLMSGLEDEDDEVDFYRGLVLDRYSRKDETFYTVQLFHTDDNDDMTYVYYEQVLFAVPRDAFLFEDLAFSRDHHLPFSFRHEMMIPDDMFPIAWKNQ